MKKALLALAALALAATAQARGYHHDSSINISIDDDENITSCDQIRVKFDGERATMREEALPAASLRSLHARTAINGGVHVSGWDRNDWSVVACRATAPGYDGAGSRPYLRGNELGVENDDEDRQSVVFFIVRAPRNAVLDLEARNGSIAVQDVSGSITAHTQNGPISLHSVGGKVEAEAQNGPIAYTGSSGSVRLNAENGPISVKLDGTAWNGSLDAKTENGPLSLKIPRDFRSGVVVESDGHGPIKCHAEACRQARRTFDDDDNRRIELGSGATVVRMSTTNGPISVKEKNDED
jgi:hypothetical protein